MIEEVKRLLVPFGLNAVLINKLEGYESTNYKVTIDNGKSYVLKHYSDQKELNTIIEEIEIVNSIKDLLPYEVSYTIEIQGSKVQFYDDQSFSRLLPYIEGTFLSEAIFTPDLLYNLGKAMALMVKAMKSHKAVHFASKKSIWDLQNAALNKSLLHHIKEPERRKLVHYFLDQFEQFTLPVLQSLPRQLIHNDFNDWNVLCEGEKNLWSIGFWGCHSCT